MAAMCCTVRGPCNSGPSNPQQSFAPGGSFALLLLAPPQPLLLPVHRTHVATPAAPGSCCSCPATRQNVRHSKVRVRPQTAGGELQQHAFDRAPHQSTYGVKEGARAQHRDRGGLRAAVGGPAPAMSREAPQRLPAQRSRALLYCPRPSRAAAARPRGGGGARAKGAARALTGSAADRRGSACPGAPRPHGKRAGALGRHSMMAIVPRAGRCARGVERPPV